MTWCANVRLLMLTRLFACRAVLLGAILASGAPGSGAVPRRSGDDDLHVHHGRPGLPDGRAAGSYAPSTRRLSCGGPRTFDSDRDASSASRSAAARDQGVVEMTRHGSFRRIVADVTATVLDSCAAKRTREKTGSRELSRHGVSLSPGAARVMSISSCRWSVQGHSRRALRPADLVSCRMLGTLRWTGGVVDRAGRRRTTRPRRGLSARILRRGCRCDPATISAHTANRGKMRCVRRPK